jgi:EmrB/QacA subfamily drug resistance transporter
MTPIAPATIFAALALMLALSGLDQTVLSTALPTIVQSLHGQSLAPWVFSTYLMASTAVIPLYGKLADRAGVRPMLLVSTGLFTLGSIACALAPSMPLLVAARGLQGLGGGGLMTLAMLAVTSLYPPAERGRRMGLLGAVYSLSTLAGPLAGALLLQVASWHAAFWINVPCAALAWVVLRRRPFGAPHGPRHRLDAAGAVLLSAALVALLIATNHDLAPATLAAAVASGFGLLLAWVAVERRAVDPILPLALFRSLPFAGMSAIAAASGVLLFAAIVFLPLYLQRGLGFGPVGSALHMLPLMLGITVGAQFAGPALRGGASIRNLAVVATAAAALGFAGMAAVLDLAHETAWAISLALAPLGLGLGVLFPLVTVVAQRSAPPARIGIATATPVMLRSLGGALGVALLGESLAQHIARAAAAGIGVQADAATAMAAGVATICWWCAATGLLALPATWALPQRSSAATQPPPNPSHHPTPSVTN